MSKADYVRSEAARNTTFDHHCHWTGCTRTVPPAMWGCKQHWFRLPPRLRARVWRAYSPGQEVTKTPSAEYLTVAREVQEWIASVGDPPARGSKPNGQDAEERLDREATRAVSEGPRPDDQTVSNPSQGGQQ